MPFGISIKSIKSVVEKAKYDSKTKKFIVTFKSVDIAELISLFVGKDAARKGKVLTIRVSNKMSSDQLISLLGVAAAGSK